MFLIPRPWEPNQEDLVEPGMKSGGRICSQPGEPAGLDREPGQQETHPHSRLEHLPPLVPVAGGTGAGLGLLQQQGRGGIVWRKGKFIPRTNPCRK